MLLQLFHFHFVFAFFHTYLTGDCTRWELQQYRRAATRTLTRRQRHCLLIELAAVAAQLLKFTYFDPVLFFANLLRPQALPGSQHSIYCVVYLQHLKC